MTTLGASAVRGNKDSIGDPKKKYFVWKTYSDGSKVKEYIDKDQIPDYAMSKKGKFDSDDQVNISNNIITLLESISSIFLCKIILNSLIVVYNRLFKAGICK